MTASTAVPLEEYLRTCYEPDAEYVHGQLVERNVGEWTHSLQQMLLGRLLLERGEGRLRVFPELRVRVTNEPRYRIPDLCVVPVSHPRERFLTTPPDLAIEIVSPDDEPADMLAKIGEYLAMGVPHIWVVDPHKRKVVEAGAHGIRESSSRIVETDLVGSVDFNELFTQLEEAVPPGE
jgi:Uma2 family endonuclease